MCRLVINSSSNLLCATASVITAPSGAVFGLSLSIGASHRMIVSSVHWLMKLFTILYITRSGGCTPHSADAISGVVNTSVTPSNQNSQPNIRPYASLLLNTIRHHLSNRDNASTVTIDSRLNHIRWVPHANSCLVFIWHHGNPIRSGMPDHSWLYTVNIVLIL